MLFDLCRPLRDRDCERPKRALGVLRQLALVRGDVPALAQVKQEVLQVRLVRREQRDQLPERPSSGRPHLLHFAFTCMLHFAFCEFGGEGIGATPPRFRCRRRIAGVAHDAAGPLGCRPLGIGCTGTG